MFMIVIIPHSTTFAQLKYFLLGIYDDCDENNYYDDHRDNCTSHILSTIVHLVLILVSVLALVVVLVP